MRKTACCAMSMAVALTAGMATAQISVPDNRPAPAFAAPDPLRNAVPAVDGDWLMFNHDQQRTGWNNGETMLTKGNVGKLRLLWSAQLSTPVVLTTLQTLTAPLVAQVDSRTLVFVMGADDTLFAVDADSGAIAWQQHFVNTATPLRKADWLCANAEQATPVIDKKKGLIYFTTSDGNLRAAGLADGAARMTPTPIVAPFSRNWSLNLVNDVVYTTAGRGCGGDTANPIESGNVAAANVSDPAHVTVTRAFTGAGRPAGPWSRSGVTLGPQGVYTQTADGLSDPAAGFEGSSVLAIRLGGRGIADSFTPPNWRYLNNKDLDLGSGSSTLFPFKGKALLATGAKEGLVYLLDANALGGGIPQHGKALYTSPRFGNDDVFLDARGVWGGMSNSENAAGERFVYFPMWGGQAKATADAFTFKNGDTSHGSVMAVKVVQEGEKFSLAPVWVAGVNEAPDMVAVANGVVYAVGTGEQTIQVPAGKPLPPDQGGNEFRSKPTGHQVLYAFDAETGKTLYTSKNILKDWNHFGEPVVAHGKVFVVSHDAHLYAFGLK